MAPTRPSTKKKNKSKSRLASKPSSSTTLDPAAIRQLLSSSTALLEQGDALSARKLARDALSAIEAAPSPLSSPLGAALTLLGSIAVETGDIDTARSYFLRAVESDPEGELPDDVGGGAEKFLWLAQLSEEGGQDSVTWFERGAGALRKAIGKAEEEKKGEVVEEKKRKLAETLCAVAEVYMTDLSWEEDAEGRCEALISEAGLVAPDHAETWQTVANVRISQERVEEAKAALERSMEVWRDLEPEDARVPAFATRIALARLVIEVGMEERAVEVVERLVGEDDESVEAWYLGGFALYNAGLKEKEEKKEDEWKSAWRAARGWLAQCLLLFQKQEYEDVRLGEHANELLETIRKEIGDDDRDEDEEWEDDDDESGEDGDEEMK
jgi:tetratricopeptide (TPR) repeat protein